GAIFNGKIIGSMRYPTPPTIIVAQPSAARCAWAKTLAMTKPGRKWAILSNAIRRPMDAASQKFTHASTMWRRTSARHDVTPGVRYSAFLSLVRRADLQVRRAWRA